MKKFLFILSATVTLQVQAQQIPNAGFESGTGHIPDAWFIDQEVGRITILTTTHNSQSYTINAHSGNYFLRLTTTQEINGPDTTVNLGYASITIPPVGHPDSFAFNVIYFPKIQEDNYSVAIEFLKWDSSMMDMVPVLSTATSGNGPVGDIWGRRTNRISYFGTKPQYDSLRIVIQSAGPGQHIPGTFQGLWGIGTTLLIDDFTLIYGTANGVDEPDLGAAVNIYPNPAKNAATVSYTVTSTAQVNLSIYDINGRKVLSPVNELQEPGTYTIPFDLLMLANGIYIYRLTTENSIHTGKITVGR